MSRSQQALGWTWGNANNVRQGDPWVKIGLRSAIVGIVFVVKGEAPAVMLLDFERFEFYREGDALVLCRRQTRPPIIMSDEPLAVLVASKIERKNEALPT